jgi:sulfoxide reductase heme-binding subunit YedZ
MTAPRPIDHGWWLASRSAGLVALLLVTASVGLGLLMAGRVMRKPGLGKVLTKVHEQLALSALVAMAVHAITLLGDPFLRPGVKGILVPFTMSHRPAFTGLGILGFYLAALLGLSFYVRRRIGPRLWRKLHKLTLAVYLMGVVHTLGAGSDASTPWLRTAMLITAAPILFLFLARVIGPVPRRAATAPGRAR